MPTSTYKPLANTTLTSTTASVTFGSISQEYRDLVLVLNGTLSVAEQDIRIIINNDSTDGNYSRVQGAGTVSSNLSTGTSAPRNITNWGYWTNTEQAMLVLQLMDYSVTDKHKVFLTRSGRASSGLDMIASRYASTASVDSITIIPGAGSLAAGTTLSLYGIGA
jgi:hypothetical protein